MNFSWIKLHPNWATNVEHRDGFPLTHLCIKKHQDAHILTINNTCGNKPIPLQQRTRSIDNETIMNFQTLPNKETWEYVCVDKDPNHMFNSFLCTFLNIFQTSFPVKYGRIKNKDDRITQWIKIACTHKRSLYACTKILKQKRLVLNIVIS
jgi:hypothetical protein